MLAQVLCIGFSTDFPSRSALEDESKLKQVNATQAMSYLSGRQHYSWKGYNQIRAVIADS